MRLKVSNVCQIVDKSQLITEQRNTVSLTNNGDGSISLTGAATDYEWVPITQISNRKIIKHHVYLLGGNSYKNSLVAMYGSYILSIGNQDFGYFSYNNKWVRFISDYTGYFQIMLQMRDVILDNFKITPQLFDLTEMYGVGNEPTTVEQFRQDFPNEMYEYSPVCWKKFRRLKYVTETKNLLKLNDFSNSWLTIKNNTIRIKKTSDLQSYSDAIFSPLQTDLKSDKYYRISAKVVGEFTGRLYKFFGNSLWGNAINNNRWQSDFTLATVEDKYSLAINQNSTSTVGCTLISDEVFIYDIMLEESDTAFVGQAEYVPSGYLPLNRGKYIANKEPVQLLDKSRYPATSTSNGITYTKNEDGSYNVNGTVTKNGLSTCLIGTAELKKNHIYLNNSIPGTVANSQKSYVECKMYYRSEGKWIFPSSRFKCGLDDAYAQITLLVNQTAGTVISDEKLCPELFDLTEMYGAGNEPTAEEFWSTHPKTTMYDYNPYNAITFR